MVHPQMFILSSGNHVIIDDIGIRVQSPNGENLGQYRFTEIVSIRRASTTVTLVRRSGETVELRALGPTITEMADAMANGLSVHGSKAAVPAVTVSQPLRLATDNYIVVKRVDRIGGIIGLFKTQRHAVEDQVRILNQQGYRVVVITPESRSFLHALVSFLLLIVTLFFFTKSPDLLIIGERIVTHGLGPSDQDAVSSSVAI